MKNSVSGRVSDKEAKKIIDNGKDYLDEILKLYFETDPQQGIISEKEKFNKAKKILYLKAKLTGHLTQWAESHLINCHLNNYKNFDSHQNEVNASEINYNSYRDAIAELIDLSLTDVIEGYKSPIFYKWRDEIIEGLKALNKGEVMPIFEPQKHIRQNKKYSTDLARNAAVLHVYRLWPKLGKKNLALNEVANKIGTSEENIKRWEKEITNKEDPNKTIRLAVKKGYLLSQEKENLRRRLDFELNKEDFYSEFFEQSKKFNTFELSCHDMLLLDYPLNHLGYILFVKLKN